MHNERPDLTPVSDAVPDRYCALSKVFIRRIGEIMNHKILTKLNNSNDELPVVGSILPGLTGTTNSR
jgi:hypothetical protein